MKYNWSFQGENMKRSGASQGQSAPELISQGIAELVDWRGETLSRMRKLIKKADPDVVEEWKWIGTPVWSHDGIICTGESYKNVVKLTFAKGASLKDPARLFNSSLDGNAKPPRQATPPQTPPSPEPAQSQCPKAPVPPSSLIDVLALLAAGESHQQILDKLSVAGFG